jgi:hypothetical protein
MVVLCWLMKFTNAGSGTVSIPVRPKTREVLNGPLFMPQNVAEQVSRLRSRTRRLPWSLSSLNLSRSYNQLATARSMVEILYASSGDRICLYGENGARGARDREGEVTRVGASKPGGERVSMERLGGAT